MSIKIPKSIQSKSMYELILLAYTELVLSSIPNISYGIIRKGQFEDLSNAMHSADKKMYEMKIQHRKESQYDNRVKDAETRKSTE